PAAEADERESKHEEHSHGLYRHGREPSPACALVVPGWLWVSGDISVGEGVVTNWFAWIFDLKWGSSNFTSHIPSG
ncbi:MAG: hypothetical protein ACKO4V_07120, partial [Planctomycetota bacterium]